MLGTNKLSFAMRRENIIAWSFHEKLICGSYLDSEENNIIMNFEYSLTLNQSVR